MALVLSLRLGDDFRVDGRKVVVSEIQDANSLTLTDEKGVKFHITDKEGVEVEPNVFVSASGFYYLSQIRIAVEAPRAIRVMRGERWEQLYGVS